MYVCICATHRYDYETQTPDTKTIKRNIERDFLGITRWKVKKMMRLDPKRN